MMNDVLDLINNEDYVQAKALLEQIIKDDEKNIEAYKNLGLCEVNLDNPISAIEAFKKVVELDSSDATSLFYLASCNSRVGNKEEAIENFSKVLELRPNYLDAYKSLGMIYIEFAQFDSTIELFKKALNNSELEPDYSFYYILATSYMMKKDYKNAAENLELALKLNPEHLSIMNSLGVCYMNLKEYDKSLEILQKTFVLDDKNSLTIYNLGVLYQTMGEYENALKFFQISYSLDPSITMLATLANCALQAQQYSMASTLYQNLVMAYPNNTQYRYSYLECLMNTSEYDKALENANLLLSLDEKNIDLIKKKGTLLRKLGRYEESVDTFTILLNRGKIDVEVYYNLAFNYIEMNDFDNAKEMFKKCIILEPHNPYAHKDLGVLYLKMNCYDWAVDEMQEAIKLEGDVSEFHYSLGVAYMMLSRIDEAKEAFKNAIKYEADNADALAYLGYVYLIERDKESALSTLQHALKIDPNNFLAKNHIAKYYFQEGKYDIAIEFLLDIIQTIKDDETLNMLAVCYMEQKEYENAMGIFYKLANKYPDNHILLTNLAKCELKCNKKEEAQEHIRQALMIFDDYQEALDLLEEINCGK